MIPTILEATFIAEARTPSGIPAEGPPEIVISGRSNVGKSTLLNRLAARRGLARTSKTPGRTRGLIFYDLKLRTDDAEQAMRFVDLPGYGYAQVSHDERQQWQKLIEQYVQRRQGLRLFLVLVDARRSLADEERQLLEWLTALSVPHYVVFTKIDKLSATERGSLKVAGKRALLTSGETGEGVDRVWNAILLALK